MQRDWPAGLRDCRLRHFSRAGNDILCQSDFRAGIRRRWPPRIEPTSKRKSRGFLLCLFSAGTLPQALSQNKTLSQHTAGGAAGQLHFMGHALGVAKGKPPTASNPRFSRELLAEVWFNELAMWFLRAGVDKLWQVRRGSLCQLLSLAMQALEGTNQRKQEIGKVEPIKKAEEISLLCFFKAGTLPQVLSQIPTYCSGASVPVQVAPAGLTRTTASATEQK